MEYVRVFCQQLYMPGYVRNFAIISGAFSHRDRKGNYTSYTQLTSNASKGWFSPRVQLRVFFSIWCRSWKYGWLARTSRTEHFNVQACMWAVNSIQKIKMNIVSSAPCGPGTLPAESKTISKEVGPPFLRIATSYAVFENLGEVNVWFPFPRQHLCYGSPSPFKKVVYIGVFRLQPANMLKNEKCFANKLKLDWNIFLDPPHNGLLPFVRKYVRDFVLCYMFTDFLGGNVELCTNIFFSMASCSALRKSDNHHPTSFRKSTSPLYRWGFIRPPSTYFKYHPCQFFF